VPFILDLRHLDVESSPTRVLDARAHALRREDRIELGQVDRSRRGDAVAPAIRETRDAGRSGDKRRAPDGKTGRCHRAHRVPDQKHARAIDGHIARDFVDEAIEEARTDAERDRWRRDQRELALERKLRQRAVAVAIEEHVFIAAGAVKRHHERERSVALGAILSRRQVDAERAVDPPDLAALRVRSLSRFGIGQFLLDGRGERWNVGEEGGALRPVRILRKQRCPRLERREA